MPLPPSASDTARRKAQRVLYADRVTQETALQYRLRNSIAWNGEPALRAGTNAVLGQYDGGMLETTEAERDAYIAAVPPTIVPDPPAITGIFAYYQKLIVTFNPPTNLLPQSPISYTASVSPGGQSASGTYSPLIITGITNGTTYTVSLTATNAAGTSAPTTVNNVDSSYTPTSFTTVGATSWTAPAYITSVEYLVVGGGGGSGGGFDNGGGGGGGGGMVLLGTLSITPGTTYSVYVGDGGVAGISIRSPASETPGGQGESSIFDSVIALGGEGGKGSRFQTGGSGAGGAAAINPVTASKGGNGGGAGGGGGGGGGSVGNGDSKSGTTAGTGGAGTSSSLSGSNVTYGIGGSGAPGAANTTGSTGLSNRGNGAGGGGGISFSQRNGGTGGSGIVILRF